MDVLIECCCGLDVHKATIVACLLKGKPHRKPHKEVRWRSFNGTCTDVRTAAVSGEF